MLINKKAVSPLIATVLLVMIVVSIGAAVMVVIQGLSEETIASTERQQQLLECQTDVVVDVSNACITPVNETNGTGVVALRLENSGFQDINGWRFTVFGMDVYDTTAQGSALLTGEIKEYKFVIDDGDPQLGNVGVGLNNISTVRVSPRIPGDGATPLVTCRIKALEWDLDVLEQWDDCNDVFWDD